MTPPKLPGDAPGLDLAHPVKKRVLPLARHKRRTAVLHRGERRGGKHPSVAIPLVGEPRLDDHPRAVVMRHHQGVLFDAIEEAG